MAGSDDPRQGWFGWARLGGTWERLVGPFGSMLAAARALDAELASRGLRVPNRHLVLTTDGPPRDLLGRLAALDGAG